MQLCVCDVPLPLSLNSIGRVEAYCFYDSNARETAHRCTSFVILCDIMEIVVRKEAAHKQWPNFFFNAH